MKRQPMDLEKLLANDATRGYFPKYTNNLYSSISKTKKKTKKNATQFKPWAEGLNRHFPQK